MFLLNMKLNLCYNSLEKCDSGGPFVIKDEKTGAYYQTGITSVTFDTCAGRSGYTNVAPFEDWIQEIIKNN